MLDALSRSFETILNKKTNHTSTDFAILAICSIIENGRALKVAPLGLDIGCRYWLDTILFENHGCKTSSVDQSENAIESAKRIRIKKYYIMLNRY